MRDEASAEPRAIAGPASSLVDEARRKLVGTLDGRRRAAADVVGELARSVRTSGQRLEGRQDWIAGAVGRGAVELDAFAETIRSKDLGEFADEVGSFARRRPALFVGTSIVAGFAVARLGKLVAEDVSRADLPTFTEVSHD